MPLAEDAVWEFSLLGTVNLSQDLKSNTISTAALTLVGMFVIYKSVLWHVNEWVENVPPGQK